MSERPREWQPLPYQGRDSHRPRSCCLPIITTKTVGQSILTVDWLGRQGEGLCPSSNLISRRSESSFVTFLPSTPRSTLGSQPYLHDHH